MSISGRTCVPGNPCADDCPHGNAPNTDKDIIARLQLTITELQRDRQRALEAMTIREVQRDHAMSRVRELEEKRVEVVGVSAIHLYTEGSDVCVAIEINGRWLRVIRAHAHGMQGTISHIKELDAFRIKE